MTKLTLEQCVARLGAVTAEPRFFAWRGSAKPVSGSVDATGFCLRKLTDGRASQTATRGVWSQTEEGTRIEVRSGSWAMLFVRIFATLWLGGVAMFGILGLLAALRIVHSSPPTGGLAVAGIASVMFAFGLVFRAFAARHAATENAEVMRLLEETLETGPLLVNVPIPRAGFREAAMKRVEVGEEGEAEAVSSEKQRDRRL